MITEVKVKEIDDSLKYMYPNRRIEIKTSGNSIITPIRAVISYEYEQKSIIPTDIAINNPITINIEHLNNDKFNKLLLTNEYYSKLMKTIELNNRLSQYSDLRFVLIKPTVRDKKEDDNVIPSPMTILKNESSVRERFIRYNIKMQQDLNLNPITIPFIDLPLSIFKEMTLDIHRSLDRINTQQLFFIDLSYQDFNSALEWLIEDLELNMVGLYYGPYRKYPLNYEILSKYVDKDVVFITAQVQRYDQYNSNISTMHYLPFFGNDIFSVFKPFPSWSRKGNEKDPLRSVRLFDKESLCLNRIQNSISVIEDLKYEFANDLIVKKILENYYEAKYDNDKLKVLRAFSKVSELNDSTYEFKLLQNYIRQNSTSDYIEEKSVLQKTLKNVTGSQTKLIK